MEAFKKRTKGLPPIPGVNIYILTPGNRGSPFVLFLNDFIKKRFPFFKRIKGLPPLPGVIIYIY